MKREYIERGSYDFKTDFNVGYAAELELAEILRKRPRVKTVTHNDNNKYDLLVKTTSGDSYTLEVKADLKSEHTGNIVVEFESRGKLSGINTTESLYWFEKLGDNFWYLLTNDLKQLIADEKYSSIKEGGDEGTSKMYVFNMEYLKSQMNKFE